MDVPEKLHTVEEAAEFFRIAPFTLRKWINEKRIEAIKMGREWRISPETMRAYIDQNKHEAVK